MAKKPTHPKGADNALDADDAALWDKIVSSTEPLSRGKNRVSVKPEPSAAASDAAVSAAKSKSTAIMSRSVTDADHAPAAIDPRPGPPPLGRFQRKDAKQLSSGRLPVDSRIDLHGMRQREAHAALRRFLADAQARGHRHVLVITGKGTPRGSGADDMPFDGTGDRPGVLRRAVPLWLNEPDLRGMVVSYAPAAPRHGGDGALYVRLRKAGK